MVRTQYLPTEFHKKGKACYMIRFQEVQAPTSRDDWQGYQPRAPTAFMPQVIFLLLLSECQIGAGSIMKIKYSNDIIGSQTRDLPAYSAVPQLTAPLC
jgi:hypothetical protein